MKLSSSFFLIFSLILLSTAINADPVATTFKNIFDSKKNAFHSLSALKLLNGPSRVAICSEFNEGRAMTSNEYIYLVKLDPSLGGTGEPLIPAFRCGAERPPPASFFVTYTTSQTDSPYFKLEKNKNQLNWTIIPTESKSIPTYDNLLQNAEKELMSHFNSEEYQDLSKGHLSLFIRNPKEWKSLCRKTLSADDRREMHVDGWTTNDLKRLNVTINETQNPIEMYVLPCLNDNQRNEKIYVALYTWNICFKLTLDADGHAKADYDLIDAVLNSEI